MKRLFIPLIACSLLALLSTTAGAARPTVEEVSETFQVEACGTTLEGLFEATIKTTERTTRTGETVTIERFLHAELTFTNPDTGRSVTGRVAGPLITTVDPETGEVTEVATGINVLFVVPGEGRVAGETGQLIFVDGELVVQRGQFEDLFPALCPLLGAA